MKWILVFAVLLVGCSDGQRSRIQEMEYKLDLVFSHYQKNECEKAFTRDQAEGLKKRLGYRSCGCSLDMGGQIFFSCVR